MLLSRRQVLRMTAASVAVSLVPFSVKAENTSEPCKVGIWSSNFEKAKELGLDCLQVSLPLRPTGNDLRIRENQEKMLEIAAETGIEIDSLAMGEFNGNPFWEIPDAVEQVSTCIDVMAAMKVRCVLISFFGKGNLNTDEKYEETIRRFRQLAPKAEDKGVILAIEAPLRYDNHLRLLEGINSQAVKIFYDPGNMRFLYADDTDAICEDILKLKGEICAVHAKDGAILGKGKLDYSKIFKAYAEAGFTGAQIIEGSTDGKIGYDESIRMDTAYLKSLRY